MSSFMNFPEDSARLSLKDAFVQKLAAKIESNLGNDQFGVDSLAQAMGMSRSNLHRKLHKLLGVSTSQFIREYRLKKALEILRNEDVTASEVAYRVGFSSATYFNTSFHRFYGFTPGEAKTRLKEENDLHCTNTLGGIEEVNVSDGKNSRAKKQNAKKVTLWFAAAIFLVCIAIFFYSKTFEKNNKNPAGLYAKSVVILPFKNLSTNEENQYFADGIMDETLNRLSGINGLRVISRTTSEKYRNVSKTTPEIAKELDVSHTLEASIQQYGDTIRIIAQLIEATSDRHVWVKDFKREYKDIFNLQSDIAKSIASELKTTLSSAEQEQIEKRYTNNIAAYNLYLKGRYFWNRRTKEDLETSIKYFEQSIEKDSNYALAYAGLADAYYGLTRQAFIPDSFGTSKTKGLLLKSIALDNDIAQAHATLGMVECWSDWDWDAAEKSFKRSIELNPNYAVGHHYYSDFLLHIRGDYEASRNHASEALLLNPLSYETTFLSAYHLFIESRYKEALIEAEKAFELNPHTDVNWLNFYIYVSLNKNNEAYQEMLEIMKTKTTLEAEGLKPAIHNSVLKEFLGGGSIMVKLIPLHLPNGTGFWEKKEKALDALEECYSQNSQFIPLINHYIFSEDLKEEARFKAILEKMNLID